MDKATLVKCATVLLCRERDQDTMLIHPAYSGIACGLICGFPKSNLRVQARLVTVDHD